MVNCMHELNKLVLVLPEDVRPHHTTSRVERQLCHRRRLARHHVVCSQSIDPTSSQSLAESSRIDLRASPRTTQWSCASFGP